MLYRRLYGVLDATGYKIFTSDTTNDSPVLETVRISNIAAEIYHFDCKLLLVRNQLFRYLIVDMISSLSSLVGVLDATGCMGVVVGITYDYPVLEST